jgi:hypothetical protein
MASQLKNDLIAWCKSVVPNDIVMPVGDNKAPRYKHANNKSWYLCTYSIWAGQRRGYRHSLQDLCVVDIDCMGIDRDERRFPELSKTVREDEERSPLFLQALQTCRRRQGGSAHPQS